MNKILAATLLLLTCSSIATGQQSVSQSVYKPIYCSSSANNCAYPIVYPGWLGIVVAVASDNGSITGTLSGVWSRDFCIGGDHSCVFHTNYTAQGSDTLTLTGIGGNVSPAGHDVFLMAYQGAADFVRGNSGTYTLQNSVFPECSNGGDCPYNWTLPITADAGTLMIAWSDPEQVGLGIPKSGPGWSVEASDGLLAVETMFCSTSDVPIIGSLTWVSATGQGGGGGSHWVMGIASYKLRFQKF